MIQQPSLPAAPAFEAKPSYEQMDAVARHEVHQRLGKEGGLFSPRISSPFYFFAFLVSLCFPLTGKHIFFAGVLIPAKS